MADASPVRFGLIGFGAWGRCHAGAIAHSSDAELVAIAARSEASCGAAREAFPMTTVFSDYRDLLARADVEVVAVVLPTDLHHEVASAGLSAGKHLLLEKPMAPSLEQCDDLIALAKQHGEPQYVLVELSRNPYRQGASGWRYDINRVGNWALEEPIHFFDLARWYLNAAGEPQRVYAGASSRQVDHPELHDNFSAIVHFAKGAYAVVSQTLAAFEHHQTVKVTGTKGALWARWSGAMDRTRHPTFSLRAFDGDHAREVAVEGIPGELFEREEQVAMLVRAIRDGAPLSVTAQDGRWSVAMCLAAATSVQTGQPVSLG